jgi:hypothetical protein
MTPAPARRILELARAAGAASIAVVGTSKNAGKSVVIRALLDELARQGTAHGLCSIGRDGEAVDALDGSPKPRFFLRAGVQLALPAALVPRSPALEIVAATDETSALGRIVLARVRAPGAFEIAGPPTAAAVRRIADELVARTGFALVDGAVDRTAALRGGGDAIVVAVGAATAATPELAAEAAGALLARLRLPVAGATADAVRIGGALTADAAAAFVRAGEARPIVVPDATHVAFGGRTFLAIAARLDLRVETPLRPIACSIASFSRDRAFEPRRFAAAVAKRTGLPVVDVYAGTVTAGAAA